LNPVNPANSVTMKRMKEFARL